MATRGLAKTPIQQAYGSTGLELEDLLRKNIGKLRVRLSDFNGPKDGADKRCRKTRVLLGNRLNMCPAICSTETSAVVPLRYAKASPGQTPDSSTSPPLSPWAAASFARSEKHVSERHG